MILIVPQALALINNVQVVEQEAKLVTKYLALQIQIAPQITVLMMFAKCAITKKAVRLNEMALVAAHQGHVMEVYVHLAQLVIENLAYNSANCL